MTTHGELPDIVERLRDVEWRAIEFSQGWGAGGAHGKMMAAFAITEIERLRATPPGSPLERQRVIDLEEALRTFAIAHHVRMTEKGGTIPNGTSCNLCKVEAEHGQLLIHDPECLLATPPQVQQSARGSEG